MKKRGIFIGLLLVLSLFFVGAVSFSFGSPSETEEDFVNINLDFSNVTGLLDFVFNWGATNYSVYDEDLILMMDFNNYSDLGESDSLVRDLSRHGHNGTVLSGALAVNSGKYNGAYSFNEGEGINISAHEDFNVDEFTVSLWVKPDKKIFTKLYGGESFFCVLDEGGVAYCWGRNNYGQLGVGDTIDRNSPVKVETNFTFIDIVAGWGAACGLLENGSALCWGQNDYGQLGDGTDTQRELPVFVSGNYTFSRITRPGESHNCGLLENGSALCWGRNNYGQLGDNTTDDRFYPGFVFGNHTFVYLSSSEDSPCGILENGTVLCWGEGMKGQTGTGDEINKLIPTPILSNNTFVHLSGGEDTNCGLLENGSAMCWGENEEGQGGPGHDLNLLVPTFVEGGNIFKTLDTNYRHTCGVLENGSALCWGQNDYGQLGLEGYEKMSDGDGSLPIHTIPQSVSGEYSFQEVFPSAYGMNSCGLTIEGQIFCWGNNNYGQSGKGFFDDKLNYPTKHFISSSLDKFNYLELGRGFGCGLLQNGSAMCWGQNTYGQLGDGTFQSSLSPVFVEGKYNFTSLDLGIDSVCGLLENGSALCWGQNDYGQLGDNSTTNRNIPVFVSGNYNFSEVSIRGGYGCGLLENGSALCWGRNNYGQLGDNTTTNRNIPVFVKGNYVFSSISVGNIHTCGLLEDGSALCWGLNAYGQLGDNTTTNRNIPVFVSGNYVFNELKNGALHTCGLLEDGSALCWGLNAYGQLGDNTTTNRNIPVFVSGNYNFSSFETSGLHSYGILQDGSVVTWGRNLWGQLGIGTWEDSPSPVFVFGNLTASKIIEGSFSTCFESEGKIYCSGDNTFACLGAYPEKNYFPFLVSFGSYLKKDQVAFDLISNLDGNLILLTSNVYEKINLSDSMWNNIVFTHSNGEGFNVFVNGEEKISMGEAISINEVMKDIIIGNSVNGQIDDLMMWNRSLTDKEVEFVYKSNLEKLNETSWSFMTSFSDLAEATYRYGAYVNDGFGWVKALKSLVVDFPDEVRRSGGSGSISIDFKDGSVTRRLPRNLLIKMKTGEIDYSFKILEVQEENVSLNFSRGVVDINLNESGKVDLDDDGFYDLEVFYSGSKGYFADLTITEIHEEIPSVREEVKVDEEVDEEIEEERKGFFRRIWDWFLGLFRRN